MEVRNPRNIGNPSREEPVVTLLPGVGNMRSISAPALKKGVCNLSFVIKTCLVLCCMS